MSSTEVVFLLRGLTREKRHWEGFDQRLQKKIPNREVICLDLPGFGDYNNEWSPITIKKISNFVLNSEEFNRYKDSKKTLVGLSLGGMVCLEMVNMRPELFKSLVIINSSQSYKTPFYKRLNFLKVPYTFFLFLFKMVHRREKQILKLTINSEYDLDLAKRWCEYFQEKPFKRRSALFQILAGGTFSLRGKTSRIRKIPGLVLVALKDGLVNPYSSEVIARLLEWSIDRHPTGGHDLTYDDPEWVSEKIKEHLDI